jgi:hypothetical protein
LRKPCLTTKGNLVLKSCLRSYFHILDFTTNHLLKNTFSDHGTFDVSKASSKFHNEHRPSGTEK